jgi:hypothetical protein
MYASVWWRQEIHIEMRIHRISRIGHINITESVKILHFIFMIVVRTQNLSREFLIFKLLNKKIRISYTSNFIFTQVANLVKLKFATNILRNNTLPPHLYVF